jgi:hypothetical protein
MLRQSEEFVEKTSQKIRMSGHVCFFVILSWVICLCANAVLDYTVISYIMGNSKLLGFLGAAVMMAVVIGLGTLLPQVVSDSDVASSRDEAGQKRRTRAVLFTIGLSVILIIISIPLIQNAPIRADIAWDGKLQAAKTLLVTAEEDHDPMGKILAEERIASIEKKRADARVWMRILVLGSLASELILIGWLDRSFAYVSVLAGRKRIKKLARRAERAAESVERADAEYESNTVNHLMDLGIYPEAVAQGGGAQTESGRPAPDERAAPAPDDRMRSGAAQPYTSTFDSPASDETHGEDAPPAVADVSASWDIMGFNQA